MEHLLCWTKFFDQHGRQVMIGTDFEKVIVICCGDMRLNLVEYESDMCIRSN